MTPNLNLLEPDVFSWINRIRDVNSSTMERGEAEAELVDFLWSIPNRIANIRNNPSGYDAEQVANDAICKFILVYVRNPEFKIHSCGHLVSILSKITSNQRKLAHRWHKQAKRVPHNSVGQMLRIESLDISVCNCGSKDDDPVCFCENTEEVERFLRYLSDPNHRQVLNLILAEFTWAEIGVKLNVDQKKVRLWVDQMRRILGSYYPNLHPQPTPLNPQPSKTRRGL